MEQEKDLQEKDSQAWFLAKRTDTPEAYQKYLSLFPQGLFGETARAALLRTHHEAEDAFWEKVLLEESLNNLQTYLKKYPKGRYREIATQKQNLLLKHTAQENEELRCWEDAQKQNTPQALHAYLKKYPAGTYAAQAQKKQAHLQQIEEEKQWKKTLEKDSRAAYEAFLHTFPNGFYAQTAQKNAAIRQKIEALKSTLEQQPDQIEAVFRKVETQMAENPDDFALYDFYCTIKQKRQTQKKTETEENRTTENQTEKNQTTENKKAKSKKQASTLSVEQKTPGKTPKAKKQTKTNILLWALALGILLALGYFALEILAKY